MAEFKLHKQFDAKSVSYHLTYYRSIEVVYKNDFCVINICKYLFIELKKLDFTSLEWKKIYYFLLLSRYVIYCVILVLWAFKNNKEGHTHVLLSQTHMRVTQRLQVRHIAVYNFSW